MSKVEPALPPNHETIRTRTRPLPSAVITDEAENDHGTSAVHLESPTVIQKPLATPHARTPLPKFQVFLALAIQFTEPFTATVIYPFITRAVRSTGVTRGDEKKTGYYAGVIESMFFLTECLSVFQWGRASDRYGRRPILLFGPLGLAVAMFGFGLSSSFWSMMAFRAAQGVFNGNIGVARTLMAEITDQTNRVAVFTLIPIMWNSGSAGGPAIGGLLAYPAHRWPKLFGKSAFFVQYPLFLPCAAAGLLAFVIFAISYAGLKESSKAKHQKRRHSSISESSGEVATLNENENTPLMQSSSSSSNSEEPYGSITPNDSATLDHDSTPPKSDNSKNGSIKSLLSFPVLRITLLNQAFLAFTEISHTVLIPLIYSTSIPIGGLGLSPYQLGCIMAVYSLTTGITGILVFRRILERMGPRKTYILSYTSLIWDFGMFWVLRNVARWYGRVNGVVWALIVAQLTVSMLTSLMWNSMGLLVISSAPRGALGATNGLAQMVSSGARCIGPIFASSIFSISLEIGLFGGHLVEIVMLGVTAVGIVCSLKLPRELDGFGTQLDED